MATPQRAVTAWPKLSDDWGYNGAACLWSSVYDGLSPAQIQQVERVISRKRLPKGTTIFGVGDAPDEVVIVVDGRIRCYVLSESGESYTVALYGHDRLTGLMSALMEVPRMATAETIETVSLDLISRRSLRQLMIEVPEFGANVAKLAAAMASDLIWALQERALRSATERLCSALLTLGRPDDGGLVTVQGLSQGDLAGIVGVSRTWVNLTLTELVSACLLTRRRLEIRILNPEALQAMLRG